LNEKAEQSCRKVGSSLPAFLMRVIVPPKRTNHSIHNCRERSVGIESIATTACSRLLQCIKKFALTFDAKSITFHADGITFGGFVSARSLGVDYPAWGLVP
jgi:hypothetical protein